MGLRVLGSEQAAEPCLGEVGRVQQVVCVCYGEQAANNGLTLEASYRLRRLHTRLPDVPIGKRVAQ